MKVKTFLLLIGVIGAVLMGVHFTRSDQSNNKDPETKRFIHALNTLTDDLIRVVENEEIGKADRLRLAQEILNTRSKDVRADYQGLKESGDFQVSTLTENALQDCLVINPEKILGLYNEQIDIVTVGLKELEEFEAKAPKTREGMRQLELKAENLEAEKSRLAEIRGLVATYNSIFA